MFRKPLVLALTVLLLNLLSVAPVTASTGTEEEVRFSEKVKGEIVKLGTGPEARIEVRLSDKTKLKGYVRESDETQFVIVDAKTGVETTVSASSEGEREQLCHRREDCYRHWDCDCCPIDLLRSI
jgi:hypothetical protein